MHRRQALSALIATVLLLAAPWPARASSIDLNLSLTLDLSAPQDIGVSGVVRNNGTVAAFDLYAELWPGTERRRLGDLQPGAQVDVSWIIPRPRWVETFHQIAAMRLRYRDALEHWADAVVAAGPESPAVVSPPRWPEPGVFSVNWTQPPSASGRVVWWRPFAVGILAPETWTGADGRLTIDGRVTTSSAIGGWQSSVYGLVLPGSPDGEAPPAGSVVHIAIDARDRGALWRVEWPWVGGWLALCVVVWAGWSRQPSTLPALAAAAALGAVALALFPPRLVGLDTTPAGGDYASHIVGLAYLRDVLLPGARAFGWFPGQFGGVPLFLFYFPLPFLAAAAFSTIVPLTVAMKMASLIGTLLLPAGWWLTLAWLGAPAGARWLAAAASAWLLLGEWQTVWGANLASTLAGEFAYSLGYVLAWMTMACAWRTRDSLGDWRLLAVLFALTAMSHGYALVAAACGVLLMILHPARGPARAWRLAWVGIVAFALAAWWLLPFLWTAPWTAGVRGRWVLTLDEYLPAPLWVALVVGGIGLSRRVLRRTADAGAVCWLAAFAVAMLGMYAAGFSLGVVDVRFLPFFHGALLLLACWEAGSWLDTLRPSLVPAAASLVIVAIVASAARQVTYLPDWVRWNFNGMERTGPWPHFNDVMQALSGTLADPRVVFEHHPDHDAVGTTRAFEMLPWFASRSTLEGLYRESALLAAPVYYIQSELTRTPSCPIEGLECGRFNPGGALPHLGLFAADTVVTYSDVAARELEQQPGVTLRRQSGPYQIFTIDRPRPIVEPVRFEPVVDHSDDWRGDAYDWFRAGTDLDVPLVLRRRARDGERYVARYAPRSLPRQPLAEAAPVAVAQRGDTIEIENARPGHPLFVKVAFHPGWRTEDGSPIDLVAPGMMLVTPRSHRVVLRWTSGWAGLIGLMLSLGALCVVGAVRTIPAAVRPEMPRRAGVGWCLAVLTVTGGAIGHAVVRHPPADYGDMMAAGQRAASAKDFALADRLYGRILSAPDRHHALRDDAGLYSALAAEAAGNPGETESRLRRFLDEFPVSTFRAEVLVRLGRVLRADGREDEARDAFSGAIDAPLADPAWIEQARTALAERPAS